MQIKQLKFLLAMWAAPWCFPLMTSTTVSAHDAYAQTNAVDQLAWDAQRVQTYKKTIPQYMRNRKLKHYALTAAVVSTALGCIWYVNHNTTPTSPAAAPENSAPTCGEAPAACEPIANNPSALNQDNFTALYQAVQKIHAAHKPPNTDWFLWKTIGRVQLPYAPRLDSLLQAVKSTAPWTAATMILQRATSIFLFREDMAWFYNEEKGLPIAGKQLEAYAINYDAACATKQPASTIMLKKELLLEAAGHYLDGLMALYAFMDYRAQQIMTSFDEAVRPAVGTQCTRLATSLAQTSIELGEKLNALVANNSTDAVQPSDTARALIVQTNNLVQALVSSFVRLETK